MLTGTTELISVNLAGTDSGNGYSYSGALSADGNIAFFESRATDLTPLPDGNDDRGCLCPRYGGGRHHH